MISYSVYLLCCIIVILISKKENYGIVGTQGFIYLILWTVSYGAITLEFTDILLLMNVYIILDTILLTCVIQKIKKTYINTTLSFIAIVFYIITLYSVWSLDLISVALTSDLYMYEILLLLNRDFIKDGNKYRYIFYGLNILLLIPHLFLMLI